MNPLRDSSEKPLSVRLLGLSLFFVMGFASAEAWGVQNYSCFIVKGSISFSQRRVLVGGKLFTPPTNGNDMEVCIPKDPQGRLQSNGEYQVREGNFGDSIGQEMPGGQGVFASKHPTTNGSRPANTDSSAQGPFIFRHSESNSDFFFKNKENNENKKGFNESMLLASESSEVPTPGVKPSDVGEVKPEGSDIQASDESQSSAQGSSNCESEYSEECGFIRPDNPKRIGKAALLARADKEYKECQESLAVATRCCGSEGASCGGGNQEKKPSVYQLATLVAQIGVMHSSGNQAGLKAKCETFQNLSALQGTLMTQIANQCSTKRKACQSTCEAYKDKLDVLYSEEASECSNPFECQKAILRKQEELARV